MQDKILLAEDETILRKVLAGGLRRKGFEVIEAPDGDTAIDAIDDGLRYDALVTDVQMPGEANGADVAAHALRNDPDVAVVIMSGDTGGIALPALGKRGMFLTKPFDVSTLVSLVTKLINYCRSKTGLRQAEGSLSRDR